MLGITNLQMMLCKITLCHLESEKPPPPPRGGRGEEAFTAPCIGVVD